MEATKQRLAALEVDLRNKQVTNNQLLENAHNDIMRNYLRGKDQVLKETLIEVQSICRLCAQTA